MTLGRRYRVSIVKSVQRAAAATGSDRVILCPWIERFPGVVGLWTSVLAGHDANASLLEALPSRGQRLPNVYAAVFAIDPLRTAEHLIHRVKQSGIAGIINFPAQSFIDGEAGDILNRLSLGMEREIEFLTICVSKGLNIAGVVRSATAAKRLVEAGADFLVVHGGAPHGKLTDPSIAAANRVTEVLRNTRIRCFPISSLAYPQT
jgi:predicted TIM-barrel enzyme